MLNGEQENFHYVSLSRLHPQRLQAVKRLSESTAYSKEQTNHCPEPEEPDRTPANNCSPRKGAKPEAEVESMEVEAEVGHHINNCQLEIRFIMFVEIFEYC